jgi:CRISPR/Cas system-associated protein Cas10 (large subunit of type III CRISPR-Cas system)
MSYFEPKKRTTSGANFIIDQRKRFAELCNQAKKIIVVGLKPRKYDMHIWEPLVQASGEIIYCGGSDSEVFAKWSNANDRASDKALDGYFKDQFEEICFELFD